MQKTLTILLTLVFLGLNSISYAIPAQPGKKTFKQPDGYMLAITLHGD